MVLTSSKPLLGAFTLSFVDHCSLPMNLTELQKEYEDDRPLSWLDLRTLNCNPHFESTVMDIAAAFDIEAKIIGKTESTGTQNNTNQLKILSENEIIDYA